MACALFLLHGRAPYSILLASCLLLVFVECFDEECIQTRHPSPSCIVTDSLPLTEKGKLNFRAMTSVGNGYLATVVMSDEIHVSGLFNGRANVIPDDEDKNPKSSRFKRNRNNNDTVLYPDWYFNHTHRARIPSPVSINYTLPGNRNSKSGESESSDYSHRLYMLDIKNGYFAQTVDTNEYTINQKTYAHRTLRNVIVTEVETDVKILDHGDTLNFTVVSNMGPIKSHDIDFEEIPLYHNLDFVMYRGTIKRSEYENQDLASVVLLHTKIPSFRVLDRGLTRDVYITVITTSLPDDCGSNFEKDALFYYGKARDMAANMDLLPSHAAAWNQIWEDGNIMISENLHLAQTVYTSFYYILSSTREDWKHGLSPGF